MMMNVLFKVKSGWGFFGVLFFLLNLTACSGGKSPEDGIESLNLRVGTPMKIKQINPLGDYSYNILAMLLTHDTLVRLDAELQPLPQLAQSWSCNENGTAWNFSIVSNALWHDGEAVTPEDVRFSFDYLGRTLASHAWIPELVREITIRGNHVVFHLNTPCSRFLVNCGFIVRILPKHIWENIPDPRCASDTGITMGCGPYVFSSHDENTSRMVFVKNESYYGEPPAIKGIELFLDRNMDILTLSMKKGEMDLYYKYASGYPAAYLKSLEKDESIGVVSQEAMGVSAALGFNFEKPVMTDERFRRALSLAIDYERINQSLFMGTGEVPGKGFVPPCFPHYADLPRLRHNPPESRTILESLGFSDTDGDGIREQPGGRPLVLDLLCRYELSGHDQLVKLLIHDLKNIGVGVKLRSADLSTWISMVRKREFDLVLFRTTPWGMLMSSGYATGYFDSRKKGGGVLANIEDPRFHRLCDGVMSTTDAEKLKELYRDIQRYYAETLPALALCWHKNHYPYRNVWQNVTINQIEGGIANRRVFRKILNTRLAHQKNSPGAGGKAL